MTEREDTIERIERVLNLTHKDSITVTIPRVTAERAVAMLKEQEAMLIVRKWHKSELGDYSRLHCPKCDHEIEKPTFLERNEASYCPYCGQIVKWK